MSAIREAEGWTAQQVEAIAARGRSVIVTAGAGSGKTGVLVECIVRSIVDDGIDPRNILAITFTNKAAAEMKNRVRVRLAEVLVERDGDGAQLPDHDPLVETIDAHCNRILTAHSLDLGIDPDYRLLARGLETARLEQRAMDAAVGAMLDSDRAEELLELLVEMPKIRELLARTHSRMLAAGRQHPALPSLDRDRVAGQFETSVAGLYKAGEALKAVLDAQLDPTAKLAATDVKALESAAEAGMLAGVTTVDAVPAKIEHRTDATRSAEAYEFNERRDELIRAVAAIEMVPHYLSASRLMEAYGEALAAIKRDESALTFADVELAAVRLLDKAGETGLTARFERVFVDEFQDVNPLQRDLINLVSGGSYYAVGDAAQAIYGFRGADVTLIHERRTALEKRGDALSLTVNFRSVEGILEVNNRVHGAVGVKGMEVLDLGTKAASPDLPVELLVADATAAEEAEVSPAELERAMLALRVKEMLDAAEVSSAGDIAILCRARSALAPIADALRSIGVAAVIEGGGGLWKRPEVDDLVALLAATGNPNDEEQLLKLLHSPMAGISTDGLVVLARTARSRGIPIWELACREDRPRLPGGDDDALVDFVDWFERQRSFAGVRSLADSIEAALVERSYDLHLLGLPEGERRFANVRALQRFADQWEADNGRNPRVFADDAMAFAGDEAADDDQEAVVEQAGGDAGAVRLMTMHGAKGLQFDTVFLPRLGSQHMSDGDRLRVSADGSRALMTAKTGNQSIPVFDPELAVEDAERQAEERARLLYVAMTRAERRLVMSATAKIRKSDKALIGDRGGASYLADIHEHIAPGLHSQVTNGSAPMDWVETLGSNAVVAVTLGDASALERYAGLLEARDSSATPIETANEPFALDPPPVAVMPSAFSYSGLQTAEGCAYRWYLEAVIGLPPAREVVSRKGKQALGARARGAIMHALIEGQPFGAGPPDKDAVIAAAGLAQEEIEEFQVPEVLRAASAILGSTVWARLADLAAAAPAAVRREESFALLLDCGAYGRLPLRGVFDVLAVEGEGHVLVVDWKTSDGVDGSTDIAERVGEEYAIQRDAYALAALSGSAGGAKPESVSVMHLYAERPDDPAVARYTQADLGDLRARLSARAVKLLDGGIAPSLTPWAGLCHGCPGRGTVCSWSLEETASPKRPG